MFPPNSRYQFTALLTYTDANGRPIPYLARRFIPAPSSFAMIQTYVVKQGDRIDSIAAQAFGDPELYWRICDANAAMQPADLTATPGRSLRITLPQGIPATPSY